MTLRFLSPCAGVNTKRRLITIESVHAKGTLFDLDRAPAP